MGSTERSAEERRADAIHWIGHNAVRLHADAELLHRAYRFPSAIFMSIACIEESTKYCILWCKNEYGSIDNIDTRDHKDKLKKSLIFILQELLDSAKEYYLSDSRRTALNAERAGLDAHSVLRLRENMPEKVSRAKLIEAFFKDELDIFAVARGISKGELFNTNALEELRKQSLYADVNMDGDEIALSHPLFCDEELSRLIFRHATKAIGFIKETSDRLAGVEIAPAPLLGGTAL